MKEEWILPFNGRAYSLSKTQNFLWKNGNVYIMDNHRAALWCWLQEISLDKTINIFHIDAHYDTRPVKNVEWLSTLPELQHINFQDYLNIMGVDKGLGKYPAIVWDNYLSLFLHLYKNIIGDFFTSTHLLGEKPQDIQYEEVKPYSLSRFFRECLFNDTKNKWIINIDLDYFFNRQPKIYSPLFSESYITEIFATIKKALDSKIILVLTVCLSPECCGGWDQSEALCYKLTEMLNIEFNLSSA